MSSENCTENKKVLYLTLKKRWFDEILQGKKKIEYREIKPYWTKRFLTSEGKPRKFDTVFFRNGYSKDSRKMEVEFNGLTIGEEYEILLGNILAIGKDIIPKRYS